MRIPPLLLAVTIIFWGIETLNIVLGCIGAAIIGSVTVIRFRLSMSDDDFVRVSDLTSIIFLSAVVLTFLNVEKVLFLKTLVQWLPIVLLPLLLSQLYTDREKIIIGTRFGFRKNEIHKHEPLDFRYYYLGLCLFSAAMANSRSVFFFPCAGVLFFWIVLANRGRAFSLPVMAVAFLAVVGLSFIGFRGAESVHEYFRDKTRMMLRNYYFSKYADPFKSHLSYGSISKLKSSGDIILRVQTADAVPALLKNASYGLYGKETWYSNQAFDYLVVSKFGWELMEPPKNESNHAKIEFYLPKEKGLLPQPYGSYRVTGPSIYELEQNSSGITRIINGASLISYDIFYDFSLSKSTDTPNQKNTIIGSKEKAVMTQITDKWELEFLTDRERVEAVEEFFLDGFSYSLSLDGRGQFSTVLENFLLGNKVGYCELFATATTLMLRNIGVPSRYVTGYMVAEKSNFENKYIVRDRHAHAWSEAYVDGRWIPVDTTPGDWFAMENGERSLIQQLSDILSYFKLQYDHFRIRTEQNYVKVLSGITIFLAAILIFRIYRRMNAKNIPPERSLELKEFTAIDSPLYDIEEQLQKIGIARYTDETFLAWAERINSTRNIEIAKLVRIFRLHQGLRFDPNGLQGSDRENLKTLAENWLATHSGSESAQQLVHEQKP